MNFPKKLALIPTIAALSATPVLADENHAQVTEVSEHHRHLVGDCLLGVGRNPEEEIYLGAGCFLEGKSEVEIGNDSGDLYLRGQLGYQEYLGGHEHGHEEEIPTTHGVSGSLELGAKYYPWDINGFNIFGGVYAKGSSRINDPISIIPDGGFVGGLGLGNGALNVVGELSVINPQDEISCGASFNVELGAFARWIKK